MEEKGGSDNGEHGKRRREVRVPPRSLVTAIQELRCQAHSPGVAARRQPAWHSPCAHLGRSACEVLSSALSSPPLTPALKLRAGGRRGKEPGILPSYVCLLLPSVLSVDVLPVPSVRAGREAPATLCGTSGLHPAANPKKSGSCLVHPFRPFTTCA